MKSWILITFLSSVAALQCDLKNRLTDLPFPDIEDESVESYQMSVEYTVPGAKQTDFYTEYYDTLFRRGRVDSHQAGQSFTYVYNTASWEAWEITKKSCKLKNITETPELYRDDQTEWTYMPADKSDRRTIGPSAMFKNALAVWNSGNENRQNVMAYMGMYPNKIRGINAQFWRRCDGDNSYIDYFFTADSYENPFNLPNLKRIPLRVVFKGTRAGKAAELSEQQYDIISFQPFISLDMKPFQLPVGLECKRGLVEDDPIIPDYMGKNIQFHAEVVYRTIKDGEGTQYWSYYSTLFFALDVSSNHLAYYHTPWSDTKDSYAESPIHTIFDTKYGYLYSLFLDTGKCEISRPKTFAPGYTLPNNGGSIDLTDPYFLFPNSEFTYIGEGTNRGLGVNIFEAVVQNYLLNGDGTFIQIPKAVITHSYFQEDIIHRETVSVKNSLAEMQMRFSGRKNTDELLTFNFYGFTTELRNRRSIFNVEKCLKKNSDDYAWVTIGFNAGKAELQKVLNKVAIIKSSVMEEIIMGTELSPVHIPIIQVDIKNRLYVTLMILGKPPILYDYLVPEDGQTIINSASAEEVSDFKTCGTNCLENENNCWGFSMCGGVCHYGTGKSAKIAPKKGCQLFKRYDLEKYAPSLESMVDSIRTQVNQPIGFRLVLEDQDENIIQIDATSIEVNYPNEEGRIIPRRNGNIPFPDIESEGIESYQMSVEYTVPGSTQTDFYTEYYDILNRRGRVDSHQGGKSSTYIYRTASWEAWEITEDSCELQNITETPKLYKDFQTEWTYTPSDKSDRRTIGPSAMFKNALEVWNSEGRNTSKIMAYIGKFSGKIRGLNAHRWRRRIGEGSYVDYYFAVDDDVNPFGLPKLKRLPLRVVFGSTRKGKSAGMSKQQYDILTFQPYISLDKKPFQLPVGRGCKRGYVEDAPEIPNFKGKDIQFHAEVVYRTINRDGDGTQFWSYYSTLFLAVDLTSNHLAYYYTPWTKTKATEEPKAEAPVHVIFDSKHGYMYNTSLDTGKCKISRVKNFFPEYKLPNDAGSISLLDPSILYPEKKLTYISEGTNRGLRVNVFEETIENYQLNRNGTFKPIPKAVITHSYLQDDIVERDTASVKNSLAQVQLRFTGRNSTVEVLTFNFFDFTTELRNRRSIFNIKRCFKDEDDYAWVTIGFNADKDKIQKVLNDVPSIKANIISSITSRSELNPVRIPIVEVDVKDGIYVSLMILGKPPIKFDYSDAEEGYTVMGANDVEGVGDFQTCGNMCLEKETNCWGFSMCGAVCYFGTTESVKTGKQTGCKLYRRYDMEEYIPSKESMINNLRIRVEKNQGFSLMLKDKDDKMVQIDASSIEVTYPGEDDRIFARIGNTLNPRMRVVKAGYKLKETAGTAIKNMGKLRYDECQRLCLDFKDCETASYCLKNSECVFTSSYGDDLKPEDMVEDNMCNLITRKYADHFGRSPGLVLSATAQEELSLDTVEKCARACLTQTKYRCLSFDHCPTENTCRLHTVHYPNPDTREKESSKSTNCGHYFRRFSTEFKKTPEKRFVGSKVPPLNNLTLEECSKSCMEYGKGTCFGFDFCQGDTVLATSCTILDSDPSGMKSTYSATCFNYLRTEAQFAPRPYSNSYAGGIGFLCFLIGGAFGAVIVFGITYFRKNRGFTETSIRLSKLNQ